MIYHDAWGVAELRIPRYFERLAERGYAYSFAPLAASGLRTDNAPPNAAIIAQIERWNSCHGATHRIVMQTLDGFFARLRAEDLTRLPSHRGDWPDWWSDGAASAPGLVRELRAAQRQLAHAQQLAASCDAVAEPPAGELHALDSELALAAEHTFSRADSMSAPWLAGVQAIAGRKRAYAAEALERASTLIDRAHEALGEQPLRPGRALRYRVVNPYPGVLQIIARLEVGHYEWQERELAAGARVLDESTGAVLAADLRQAPMAAAYAVALSLPPRSERWLRIEPCEPECVSRAQEPCAATAVELETEACTIVLDTGSGIASWRDRSSTAELLHPQRRHAPFQPVYERTPIDPELGACGTRGAMLLNRKGEHVRRWSGELASIGPLHEGRVSSRVELTYRCEGCADYAVELEAHHASARVDVTLRLHKQSRWEPENVYVALPFSAGTGAELWLEKAGAAVRPRVDQLPGTLSDYYAVQDAICSSGETLGVALASPDVHLLQLGPLEHGERLLMGDARLSAQVDELYAWPLNNFWETNFEAELGGFHAFRFSVLWGEELRDPAVGLEQARLACRPVTTLRVGPEP